MNVTKKRIRICFFATYLLDNVYRIQSYFAYAVRFRTAERYRIYRFVYVYENEAAVIVGYLDFARAVVAAHRNREV